MSKGAHEPEWIVVGVSQSPASSYAVLWAAQEARIRRHVLLVTHVDPPSAYAPDLHDAATACHRLLANSATVASEAQPSVAVGTLLLTGSISDELVRLSQSAALIVVGIDHDVPRAAHGAIGSIEDRVVVQAHCPVVTVLLFRRRSTTAATSRSGGPMTHPVRGPSPQRWPWQPHVVPPSPSCLARPRPAMRRVPRDLRSRLLTTCTRPWPAWPCSIPRWRSLSTGPYRTGSRL